MTAILLEPHDLTGPYTPAIVFFALVTVFVLPLVLTLPSQTVIITTSADMAGAT